MRWGEFDFSSFEELNRRIDTAVNDELLKKTAHKIINTAGNQAFRGVKMRTPVRTGTLRRTWKRSRVKYQADNLIVTISNNTEYAPYVEFGHRIMQNGVCEGFVNGVYMLCDSMAEAERSLPLIADKECKKALRQILNNE